MKALNFVGFVAIGIYAGIALAQAYGPQGSPQLPAAGASFLGDPNYCNNATTTATVVLDSGVTAVPTANLARRTTVEVCNAGNDAGDVLKCVLVSGPTILDGGPSCTDAGIQLTPGYGNINCPFDAGIQTIQDNPYCSVDGGIQTGLDNPVCYVDGGIRCLSYADGGPFDGGIQVPNDCSYIASYAGSGEDYVADGGPCDAGITYYNDAPYCTSDGGIQCAVVIDGGPFDAGIGCAVVSDGGPFDGGILANADGGPNSVCQADAGILVYACVLDTPYDAGYSGTPSQGQTLNAGQCLPYSAGSGAQLECSGNDIGGLNANTLECQ